MFNIFYEDNLILNKSAFLFLFIIGCCIYFKRNKQNDGFNNYTDIQ